MITSTYSPDRIMSGTSTRYLPLAYRSALLFFALVFSTSASCLSVSITVYQGQAPCGQPRGSMRAQPSGGTPPYAIVWSNGATTNTISELPMGTYTVTVTDNDGTVAQASADVTYMAGYPQETMPYTTTSCTADVGYAIFPVNDAGGLSPTAPATFSGSGVLGQSLSTNGQWYLIEINDAPGQTTIYYTDALNCGGSFLWNINGPVVLPPITVSGIGGSCSDGATGSATVSVPAVGGNDLHFALKDGSGTVVYQTLCANYQPSNGFGGLTIPFSALAPGDYWAVLDVDKFCLFGALPSYIASCADSVMITIPDLGVTCGTVAGTSWYDVNGDCVLDAEDVGIPYSTLRIEPGPEWALTGADGTYQFELPDGSYTLEQSDPSLIPICPVVQPVPFTVNNDDSTIDLANGSTHPLDLVAYASCGAARPGSISLVHVLVHNSAPQLSGPVTITVNLDNDVNYVNATPAPTSVVGNTLTWDLPAFGLFGSAQLSVETLVPVGTVVGTPVDHSLSVSNTLAESNYTNNVANAATVVTASLDPNEKIARTSTGLDDTRYFINLDDYIDYTIRFQNTGNDTAFTVVITDTLTEALDMQSFEQSVASHPFTVRFKAGRVVEWRFSDILLPDSTTNEALSHGLVSFRIKPIQPPLVGTAIINTANIYFDYNDPVITEPSMLVVESTQGVQAQEAKQDLWLMPNPTSGSLEVRVSDNSASGLLHVVSVDGRVVMERRMQGPRTVLDVTELARGLYTLNWYDENGTVITQRFVKE